MHPSRAVLYLRKSRADDPGEEAVVTLSRHEESLRRLADERQLTIVDIYREVVSGDKLATRYEMQRLLADCASSAFDMVLCMDIDRLGRGSMAEQGLILDTLKEASVHILTPRKEYNLRDDLDETYSEFESFMARQELKIIKRRLQRGITHSAQYGSFLSVPPYGYRRTLQNGHPSLEPLPTEAEAVSLIFSWYVYEGLGSRQIADRLNAMGYLPRRAAFFSPGSVLEILANPVYVGRVVRRGKSAVDVPGLHPPLVSVPVFEAASAKRQQRSHPPTGPRSLQNPLAGLIFCAHCGSRLQRLPAGRYRRQETLSCPTRGCNVASRLSAVESAVATAVLAQLPSRIFPEAPSAVSTAGRRTQLEEQQERLYTLLEQGIYTPEEYSRRRATLAAQMDALSPPRQSPQHSVATATAYQNAPPAERNAFLRQFVKRIVYEKSLGAPPTVFTVDIYWLEDQNAP